MKNASMPEIKLMGESIKTLGYEVREWHESQVYKTATRGTGAPTLEVHANKLVDSSPARKVFFLLHSRTSDQALSVIED